MGSGWPTLASLSPTVLARRAAREDEVQDVLLLLLEHADPAAGPVEAIAAIAETVAVACLGDDHLWQDLGFGSRTGLSALMRTWFPRLVERNAFDMKWKKFFYRTLCERAEVPICKSPSCAACDDRHVCFEPGSPLH